MHDDGVTPVLGTIMMLALMATLVPGALLMRAAMAEEMEAHRSAAEHAAWCARHPEVGPPDCDARGPMPGYSCEEVEVGLWVCRRPLSTTLEEQAPKGEVDLLPGPSLG